MINFLLLLIRSVISRICYIVVRKFFTIVSALLNPVFAFLCKIFDRILYRVFPYSSEKFREKTIDDFVFILIISCFVLILGYHFFATGGLLKRLLVQGQFNDVQYYGCLFFLFLLPMFAIIRFVAFSNDKNNDNADD